MNYNDLIEQLFQINLFGAQKKGLENCQRLDQLLDFPHHTFQSIHVAGTNGKGSVTTKIASALQAAGFKVGLFTSPHIACFRERIRINGEKIPQEAVEKWLSYLFQITQLQSIPATFFELTTYLAFLYFKEEKIDYAVLEAGLGGRLDATNIVTPLLTLITSISLDHTEILGNSLELITKEKAGIIKPQVPLIIGPKVPLEIIKRHAIQFKSPWMQVESPDQTFEEENTAIAKAALNYLSSFIPISEIAMNKGLISKPPCRLEIISTQPTIILDVAHNPDGLKELFKAIHWHYPQRSLRVLFGLSKSKDVKSCLTILAEQKCFLYPITVPYTRTLPAFELELILQQLGVDSDHIISYSNLLTSVQQAKQDAKKDNSVLVVCGSFFIMSEIKRILNEESS